MIRLIGNMICLNEADIIEYSIRSVIGFLDELIVIEGAYGEHTRANNHVRSTDGTLEILDRLQKEFDNLTVVQANEPSQLEQRNVYFKHAPQEPHAMLLIDADEVWDEENLNRIHEIIKDPEGPKFGYVYEVQSKVFINDFYTYSPVNYPRLWFLGAGPNHQFVEPNRITTSSIEYTRIWTDLTYFHYSYTHSPERFLEKKKERTLLHGHFPWELRDGLVQRDDANIMPFKGEHPPVMQTHPLYGLRKHREVSLDSEPSKRIIYVEHSGLGNLILATPALCEYHRVFPDHEIHVVCWDRSKAVLEGCPYITSVASNAAQIQHLGSKPFTDLYISPVGALDNIVEYLARNAREVHRVEKDVPWIKHEAEYKCDLLNVNFTELPKIHLNQLNFEKAAKALSPLGLLKPKIAINAGYLRHDHWYKKHWGDQKFVRLIGELQDLNNDIQVVLVGSQDDRENLSEKIQSAINFGNDIDLPIIDSTRILNLCGLSNDIRDTAAVLRFSDLLIGNDGGLQHLATTQGCPTITIFTFTNVIKNRPLGDNNVVIYNECDKRLMCQHGNHDSCECLDVSFEKVWGKVYECAKNLLSLKSC